MTRFDVPDYALNLPHSIEFLDQDRFTISLDGDPVLEGRVGEAAIDSDGLYRLFIQSKTGPSAGSFSVTRLDQLSAIEELRERLVVAERGKDTGILSVTLDSPSRREASETLRDCTDLPKAERRPTVGGGREALAFLEKQIPTSAESLSSPRTT